MERGDEAGRVALSAHASPVIHSAPPGPAFSQLPLRRAPAPPASGTPLTQAFLDAPLGSDPPPPALFPPQISWQVLRSAGLCVWSHLCARTHSAARRALAPSRSNPGQEHARWGVRGSVSTSLRSQCPVPGELTAREGRRRKCVWDFCFVFGT